MSIAPWDTSGTGMRVYTRPIPALDRPIELLPDERGPLCWVRGAEGLVGWGEVARFTSGGPERFADADRWWRAFAAGLDVVDEVGLPGTGAVAFASFAFAPEPGESMLVVPRVVVGTRNGAGWITEIVSGDGQAGMQPVTPVRAPRGVRYADGRLPVARWREAVAEAVARMRRGDVRKAVFAHDLLARAEEPLDPRFLLRQLVERYPTCWAFAVDGLIGATPELLLRRAGTHVGSRVLAGTRWPGEAGCADVAAAGSALMNSAKDRDEHRYAVDSLIERLRPLSVDVHAPDRPSLLPLHNLVHLATDVTATLRDTDPPSLLELAAAVHPTAAVGGTPREPALRMIAELEEMDRGRYSGPVGWVDAAGDGELGLALRCAQVSGSTARLFAGCGVVAESDPDTEVREAAAKLEPIRQALEGAARF